jgi:hypothetical protein
MPVWRPDDAGQGYTFKLTPVGLKAIAVDEGLEKAIATSNVAPQRQPPDPDATNAPNPTSGVNTSGHAPPERAASRHVIDLLHRSEGATILHIVEATGWLPHTTRAALTGLRKRGYAVARERVNRGDSIYRIADPATNGGDRAVAEPEASSDDDPELEPKASRAA